MSARIEIRTDICTGCGPGAMKGPMKGAAIGHVKQRVAGARYIGLTEPGIIAAEPPSLDFLLLPVMPLGSGTSPRLALHVPAVML